uniref:Myelin protein zero-like 2b n=1 Tax=Nothobranchius rachovii TaxID=451742 RepID=A0A1A8P2S5_9TELE
MSTVGLSHCLCRCLCETMLCFSSPADMALLTVVKKEKAVPSSDDEPEPSSGGDEEEEEDALGDEHNFGDVV